MKKNSKSIKNENVIINESNIDNYIVGKGLVLNKIIDNSIKSQDLKVNIENIKFEKNLSLVLNDFNFPRLHLEIRNCEFVNLLCNSKLHLFWVKSCTIGKNKDDKIIFDSSNILNFEIINSTINTDISMKNKCVFDRFQISSNLIKSSDQIYSHGISFSDSLITEFSIENINLTHIISLSSNFHEFCIRNCFIEDSVNLLSSELNSLIIENTNFLNVNKSKTNFFERSDFNNNRLETVSVVNCTFPFDVVFDSDVLKSVFINKSSFKNFYLEYFSCDVKLYDNEIQGNCHIGASSKVREIKEMTIKDNSIDRDLKIGAHVINESFELGLNTIKNGRIELEELAILGECDISRAEFEGAKIFRCHLNTFDFKDSNIYKANFEFCRWKEEPILFLGLKKIGHRIVFKDEDDLSNLNLSKLKKLNEQYSNFKRAFEESNNYIDAGKFKISEQLVRTKILFKEKMWFQAVLLKIHENLSFFGESILLPFFWLFISVFGFALLYLFHGFKSGNTTINYELSFDCNYFTPTIVDFFHSLILSLKNLNPIRIENFYLGISESSASSQRFYLFQKLLNIILIGSLIGAIRNFIRK